MQTITPFLLFGGNAEEAVNFYCSVFKNSSIQETTYYGDAIPEKKGTAMTLTFKINGQKFVALNGPVFEYTPAVSWQIGCETQEEVDELWNKLTEGGEESWCGWLKDKFGISWQITPNELGRLIKDPDPEKSARVMSAMMEMQKIDIAKLQAAYNAE